MVVPEGLKSISQLTHQTGCHLHPAVRKTTTSDIIKPNKPQSHSYLGLTAAHIYNLYHIHMSSSADKNAEKKKRLDHIWSPVLEGIQGKVDKNQTTQKLQNTLSKIWNADQQSGSAAETTKQILKDQTWNEHVAFRANIQLYVHIKSGSSTLFDVIRSEDRQNRGAVRLIRYLV